VTVSERRSVCADDALAVDWLADLEQAFQQSDAAAAALLFHPAGHWRDVLAFTWHLHTYQGRADLEAAFRSAVPATQPKGFHLNRRTPPRQVSRGGVEAVEAFFDFETALGRGEGVVRLVRDDDGKTRAWTLLTTLHELRGCEEHTGARRPRGEQYARNFGGANWLDRRRAAREYRDSDPTVLVVGGGQAGLAVAARLGQLDVDTLVVDRMERVGDNWRTRYHSLTLHNETWVNHLPYVPFPDTWPVYLPKDKLANWLEAYVETMEINFWTATEFVSATYDEAKQHWTVVLRRGDGSTRTLNPRHVVLATGVSGIPNIPDIPGLADFAGEVMHSGRFTDGSAYTGKRALVFGTGNSAHDVTQALHAHGADVTMVQRSSTTVVSVEPSAQKVYALYSEGLPTSDADLINISTPYEVLKRSYQLVTREMQEVDGELLAGLEAAGFRTDFGHDGTGFQMKYMRRGGGYYLNVGCSELIINGDVGLLQYADIERLVPEGALLRDGTVVPAHLVILGTGYQSQQELVRAKFGDEVADRVGPVWGFDAEGELRNMWKRTAQEGLWFMAGSLSQCRIFSRFLALQIKGIEEGLVAKSAPEEVRTVTLAETGA
jgi:cation diffusion facilitator CzcD-associated flavoprotein CzcO